MYSLMYTHLKFIYLKCIRVCIFNRRKNIYHYIFLYKCLSYRYDHAMALANGSATSEEGDEKNYRSYGYEKRRYGEETIVKEMLIFMIHCMDD